MMPKRIFQKYLPHPSKVAQHKSLQFMSHLLTEPNLWHFNRRSVAGGVFIGLLCALLPIPGQMPIAALLAIILRGNLPLAVCSTWVSNPITYAPIFYFTYKLGTQLLDINVDLTNFEFTWDSIKLNFNAIWKPLLLGSLISGFSLASIGYMIIRLYWRIRVLQMRKKRKAL
jgi:uncharacterized protein (DUF2062 family)